MSLWKTAPVEEEPSLELRDWQVFEIPSLDGEGTDHHFVGSTLYDPGRVSSQIVSFDQEEMVGTTRSGRRYKLVGEPRGFNKDARYVWANWKRIMKVDEDTVVNVTEQYTRP